MSTIKKQYLNPKVSASFSGKSTFAKNRNYKDKNKVSAELDKIRAYYLHAPAPKKFPRRKIIALYPNMIWCADLIDLIQLERSNRNFRYILVVLDAFTK